jgi:hypothetical protein
VVLHVRLPAVLDLFQHASGQLEFAKLHTEWRGDKHFLKRRVVECSKQHRRASRYGQSGKKTIILAETIEVHDC